METQDDLWSPQLVALQQQLQAGNHAALTAFWERSTAQGTPLDDQHCLVTLVWREREWRAPSELTCALGGLLNSRKMAHPLLRLSKSALWYRTYRLRRTVRATYHFFLQGEPTSDPLSHNEFIVPPDTVSVYGNHEMKLAIVELPDAAPEVWTKRPSGTPHGSIHSQRMESKLVGHEYRLSVYTPSGYRTRGPSPYPLLLLFDEWTSTQVIPATTLLDTMIAQSLIPPLVAVLFGHVEREDRMREMAFYEPFFLCVEQEVLPWIQDHYFVTSDPTYRTVGGASMGGIAAVYSGVRFPEHFGNVYSHTGAFHAGSPEERAYQRLERMCTKRSFAPQRFYLDVGMLECDEMGCGSPDGGPNALESNRAMRDILRACGYEVTYREYSSGHDLLWGSATLVEGLKGLVGRR